MRPPNIDSDYFSPDVLSQSRRFIARDRPPGFRGDLYVDLVAGACEWCAPDFAMSRDNFPHLAFEFVWSGRGQLTLGTRCHDIGPGSVFFYDSTTALHLQSHPQAPLVKYFFSFTGPRIDSLLHQFGLRAGAVFRMNDPARLADLLEEALVRGASGTPQGTQSSCVVLEHAISLCANDRSECQGSLDTSYITYLRCRDFMVQHYARLMSIAQVAKGCSVSAPYLSRLFKRFDRETPHACLRRLRMQNALQRLRQPQAMAKAVAMDLGFNSLAHFSRVFKDYHGMTPQNAKLGGP